MNEFPRLRARVEAAEHKVEQQSEHMKVLENMIVRLAEQINQLQQRKPGRPKKET